MLLSALLILCGTVLLAHSDDSCVYYQDVAAGDAVDFIPPNYPLSYPRGANCRWEAVAPSTSHFILDCSVSMPQVSDI
jgi:hypothetical protein